MTAVEATISNVQATLEDYAHRGVFQKFSVATADRGKAKQEQQVSFNFRWLCEDNFRVILNPTKNTLELHEVLPAAPFRSEIDQAFRDFLKQRTDKSIPEHRRLDDQRFSFKCSNKNQKLSIRINFNSGDEQAAAKTAVNLYHEIFNHFLMDGPYQNYMIEHFGISEE